MAAANSTSSRAAGRAARCSLPAAWKSFPPAAWWFRRKSRIPVKAASGSGLGVFGTASGNTVGSNGQEGVFSGGTDIGATVLSGGFLTIHSGGLGVSATLSGNTASSTFGDEFVRSGGRTSHTVINSGGFLSVSAGGLVVSTIVNSTGIGTSVGGLLLSGAAGGGTASATS